MQIDLHGSADKTMAEPVRLLDIKTHLQKNSIAPSIQAEFRSPPSPSRLLILGVPVSAIDFHAAVETIVGWTKARAANYVCCRDVHGVMLALQDPELMAIHHGAGLVTPDGMPLVWILRRRSNRKIDRVCGADLVDAVCKAGQSRGVRHYFYGGKPSVAEAMIRSLKAKYPDLVVAGSHTPPFRPLTAEEDEADVEAMNDAGAQVVWVGLNTPKQEYWMRDHVGRIKGATLIGVGAAFDFHSGAVKRAPKWMQGSGLEWMHRLYSEPRRLWRRYLVIAPAFVLRIIGETIRDGLTRRWTDKRPSITDKRPAGNGPRPAGES